MQFIKSLILILELEPELNLELEPELNLQLIKRNYMFTNKSKSPFLKTERKKKANASSSKPVSLLDTKKYPFSDNRVTGKSHRSK